MSEKYMYVPKRFLPKNIDAFPCAGPNPSIKGMRNLYWGDNAYIIKSGRYAYKVPQNVFYSIRNRIYF